jgi:hypothetical protein
MLGSIIFREFHLTSCVTTNISRKTGFIWWMILMYVSAVQSKSGDVHIFYVSDCIWHLPAWILIVLRTLWFSVIRVQQDEVTVHYLHLLTFPIACVVKLIWFQICSVVL